jgi:hypothetical protein
VLIELAFHLTVQLVLYKDWGSGSKEVTVPNFRVFTGGRGDIHWMS